LTPSGRPGSAPAQGNIVPRAYIPLLSKFTVNPQAGSTQMNKQDMEKVQMYFEAALAVPEARRDQFLTVRR